MSMISKKDLIFIVLVVKTPPRFTVCGVCFNKIEVVMDYFSLFGLPVHYQIDIQQLMFSFQELQQKYHPDKFINGTEIEKLNAIKQSSIINQACHILRNPLTRAEHLLFLHGFDCKGAQFILCDKIFLSKQLDLHEELENLKKMKDKTQLKTFIQHMKEMLDIQYKKMIEQLNNKQWNNAVNTVGKIRFLDKLHNSAEQFEEKLFNL